MLPDHLCISHVVATIPPRLTITDYRRLPRPSKVR